MSRNLLHGCDTDAIPGIHLIESDPGKYSIHYSRWWIVVYIAIQHFRIHFESVIYVSCVSVRYQTWSQGRGDTRASLWFDDQSSCFFFSQLRERDNHHSTASFASMLIRISHHDDNKARLSR